MSESQEAGPRSRKIVHIDMDCFYAAIEIRDAPELRGKPVAVGGSASRRGVLTTCSYEAREYGCRSAMPTYQALQRCPELIVLPVRFEVYRVESQRIREVFHRFTDVVEPLSLDEAYLDITDWQSSGASVAREIREEIREVTGLTASAGIAPNKLLAKIASDWNKPNGQFEVLPKEVDAFMRPLPVRRLWGVGEKTAGILAGKGIETCGDLQGHSLPELHRWLGKFGIELYHQCRGKDDRSVKPSRERKSLSNERTFPEDLMHVEQGLEKLMPLWHELCEDLSARHSERAIKSVFIKLKFHDFRQTTVERQAERADWEICEGLMMEGWQRASGRGIRLIGVGVRFQPVGDANGTSSSRQLWLFEDS